MREIREWFAWYSPDSGVEYDLEDLHDLGDMSSVDSVEYTVDYLWHSYNLPSRDGKLYVCDYVDWEDLSFNATLRVRFVELIDFSDDELAAIGLELEGK